jgi:hypothetical protein
MSLHGGRRTVLAWCLWLATLGCLAGGLGVTLLMARPLTADVLVDGAFEAGDSLWAVGLTLAVTLLLLPSGRLRSRRWRVVVVAGIVGTAIEVLAGSCRRIR